MGKKIGDIIQLSKISEMIKKDDEERKISKFATILLICAGAVVVLTGVGFLLYKLLGKRTDDYDLYDDLDNYYDESDHYEVDKEAGEANFAE